MSATSSPGFAHEVRRSAGAEWEAATTHRLFREIIDDTVADPVFERYLRIEYGFIDTAAVALGAAVQRAPRIEDRVVLAAGLHDLLTTQVEFFATALGGDQTTLEPASARALHRVFGEVADRGEFAELLAAMMASEWLYETWAAEASRPSGRDTVRDWVDLHRSPDFRQHAGWLRGRIDRMAADLSPLGRARIAEVFRAVIVAEISFHDAAYEQS